MATKQKMDLLTAVEKIVEKAKGTGLSSEFYQRANRYIKYMSEKMNLTKEQSVMMALFIDHSDNSSISIRDLSNYLECRTTRMIKHMSEIDVLEKKELVRCSRSCNTLSYRVPYEVINAFKNNEKYEPRDCSGLSCMELFVELETIFGLRKKEELTYEKMADKIHHLLECNKQLLFVQKVLGYGFEEIDLMMLILFSHFFVNDNDDNIITQQIHLLVDDKRSWTILRTQLNTGDNALMEAKLIEHTNENGFINSESFRMTDKAKQELFTELNLKSLETKASRNDVVKHEDITPKQLFYNENVSKQVTELGTLLKDEQYNRIRSRMKDTGFRCAFTCLFYGAPGTGKTETVLQLARQTGRDIMQVDMTQIKSCWVGESEKNIKQVFDNYRAKVKESTITPILLFNEADAIIGTRMEDVQRSVDKMMNSIQNIILQEMESLDGILIATTNLAQSMDKAFERRFLYKIKFEKPTVETRISMWHDMIPSLNEEQCHTLASKYDFSGGQIENIARHFTIGNILHGEPENVIEVISSYCDSEQLETKETIKVGFC